jgi:hypothetical protein
MPQESLEEKNNMAQDSKSHRTRKNGASREEWQERKRAANAARGPQTVIEEFNPAEPRDIKITRRREAQNEAREVS